MKSLDPRISGDDAGNAARASVTEAIQVLEGSGTIDSKRGHVWVRDRAGLEKVAGDCYGLPESELARVGLLGAGGGSRKPIEATDCLGMRGP